MRHVLAFFNAPFFFFLVVLVFAVIHDPADRRLGRRRDLDEIEVVLFRQVERAAQDHNAQLFGIGPDHADLRSPDTVIDADEFSDNPPPV